MLLNVLDVVFQQKEEKLLCEQLFPCAGVPRMSCLRMAYFFEDVRIWVSFRIFVSVD